MNNLTLNQARKKCADFFLENAKQIREENPYAAHVTGEEKELDYNKRVKFSEEIREGKHDGNFTVAQRIHFYMTGNCVPFLSK
jgi:hypothetical protein